MTIERPGVSPTQAAQLAARLLAGWSGSERITPQTAGLYVEAASLAWCPDDVTAAVNELVYGKAPGQRLQFLPSVAEFSAAIRRAEGERVRLLPRPKPLLLPRPVIPTERRRELAERARREVRAAGGAI